MARFTYRVESRSLVDGGGSWGQSFPLRSMAKAEFERAKEQAERLGTPVTLSFTRTHNETDETVCIAVY